MRTNLEVGFSLKKETESFKEAKALAQDYYDKYHMPT